MEQNNKLRIAGLQKQGIEIETYSITPAGDGRKLFEDLGITVEDNDYSGKFGWRTHRKLSEKLKHVTGDAMLVTGPTLTGCLAARNVKCRTRHLAVDYHHGKMLSDKLKWKAFYSFFGQDYQSLIYPTHFLKDEAAAIVPHLAAKMTVLPNAVEGIRSPLPRDKSFYKEKLAIKGDTLVIGNAGWLIERKRFDVFLSVAARIAKRLSPCCFVIAGDGELLDALQNQAASLGIANHVKFIGWQSSLHNFYAMLDLMIFNTDADAFGRAPMEAMTYGVPVVASMIYGGTDEIVINNQTGFLLREHNVEQLAEYAIKVLTDERLRAKLTANAIDKIKRDHTTEVITNRLLKLLGQ